MSRAVVHVSGNMGRDPERKQSQNGNDYVSFSIAVNNRNGGNDDVTWYNCRRFGNDVDTIMQYFQKGSGIIVHGDLTIGTWQDRQGRTQVQADVFVQGWDFPPGKRADSGGGNGGGNQFANQHRPAGGSVGAGNFAPKPPAPSFGGN